MKLSLIIPCYNEEGNIKKLFDCVNIAFENKIEDYEFIFINDGSKDKTNLKLKELLKETTKTIKIIDFSRNFGKEAAIFAGLQNAEGSLITIIDADLQQRPEIVVDMVSFLEQHPEYDCVAAFQEKRMEGKTMSFVKSLFYKLINKICDIDFKNGASDFRTFRRNMAEAMLSMPEYFRFSKGIFSWVGFETYYMPYVVEERFSGTTKWSLKKLIKYALEGFISFTTFPLKIATFLGLFTSFAAVIYLIIVLIEKLVWGIDIQGYATTICLILLLGGIQLLVLGIIGEYLSRMYIQEKNRPIYIIKSIDTNKQEKLNDKKPIL